MATIEVRKSGSGETTYRVKVRLKGFPQVSATFARKTDAKKWAEDQGALLRARRHFPQAIASKVFARDVIERYINEVLPTKPRSARSQKAQLMWWRRKLISYRLAGAGIQSREGLDAILAGGCNYQQPLFIR